MTTITKEELIQDIRRQKSFINQWKRERRTARAKLTNVDKRIEHHSNVISMLADDLIEVINKEVEE
jgi:hypothetical protein